MLSDLTLVSPKVRVPCPMSTSLRSPVNKVSDTGISSVEQPLWMRGAEVEWPGKCVSDTGLTTQAAMYFGGSCILSQGFHIYPQPLNLT